MKFDSYEFGKRILDIFGALVGIILFSPIMILAALWVKIVSPSGGVFADIPNRVGKNREPFKFLKFRSMIPNAHNFMLNEPALYKKYVENNYKIDPDEDPRFLPGAKFVRKYSIDELPQFFNVLKGDMSIVGPRAYFFSEVEEQGEKYPEAKALLDTVFSVKPGITGLWQVSGRSEIGFPDRVKLDATYARKRSLIYDIILILKTPYVVITGKGAF
ncbi:MAG: sugar transferase [Patescibacteria group bacterium]